MSDPALIGLEPVFQPIVDLATGQIAGFETLARWRGAPPTGPAAFADPRIGVAMVEHAAAALAEFRGKSRRDLFVSVNLTGDDLSSGRYAVLVQALIVKYGLPFGALRIELTEHAALHDLSAAATEARAIKDAGAAVVLDDFGAGYASFLWLSEIPADGLKVDQDLVSQYQAPRMQAILKSVAALAKTLGMTATAEGVERPEIGEDLQALGYDYGQGFCYGRPGRLDETAALISAAG